MILEASAIGKIVSWLTMDLYRGTSKGALGSGVCYFHSIVARWESIVERWPNRATLTYIVVRWRLLQKVVYEKPVAISGQGFDF